MMDWDGGTGHMSGAGWFAMALLLLLLVAFVVVAVYTSVRVWRPAGRGTGAAARRVLDERFARGEIDPDDYRVRRELLDRETPP